MRLFIGTGVRRISGSRSLGSLGDAAKNFLNQGNIRFEFAGDLSDMLGRDKFSPNAIEHHPIRPPGIGGTGHEGGRILVQIRSVPAK